MFMRFFTELRQAKVPVTLKEYLMLMEGLDKMVIDRSVDDFYYLSRAALVKDEKNIDKFDQVFAHVFKGLERMGEDVTADIPAEWLKKLSDQFLTDEEKAQIEAMGGFDKLMEMLAERIREQKERHEKGDKAIGAGGTSPFGANSYHPERVRIGQDKGRRCKAISSIFSSGSLIIGARSSSGADNWKGLPGSRLISAAKRGWAWLNSACTSSNCATRSSNWRW